MTKAVMIALEQETAQRLAPQFNDDILVSFLFNLFMGDSNSAATLRWILQQLHSKAVLAPIQTIKHPFSDNGYMKSLEFYENYNTLFCLEKNKLF